MRAPFRSYRGALIVHAVQRRGERIARQLLPPLVGLAALGVLWLIGWWDTPQRIAATIIGVLLALLAGLLVASADDS